ncbi:MAG: amidohydrolase [SAR202 cluster bacterium Casp-Chloro-G4]|nr:amidohydrolase family protein [Chloroflexota bacterium]MDA1226663.1 amidohydrolase family protein [Chloroflexota bacterium]PKB61038.1 MAG: amidohydrolase [SAR202 cluster bacterium Casp-Chloro-G4]
MVTPREDWLKLTEEGTLEPDLPICDPHHHLWDRPDNRYILEDLLSDTNSGHNITSTVFVEASSEYRQSGPDELKPLGETEYVYSNSGMQGSTDVIAGIVGHVDFTIGERAGEILDMHIETAHGKFRGIRHASPWDASPDIPAYRRPPKGLLGDSKFREGFAQLQPRNLSYDAWLYHPQILELDGLAKAFPDTTIILDHIGGPLGIGPYADKRDEIFPQWQADMAKLSENPNVVVKVGGCGMVTYGFDWHLQDTPPTSEQLAERTAPYYMWCIEKFGPERCMFESNFPVDKASFSYNVMWNAFKRMSKDFSASERASLFHDTATRAYRLS